MSRVEENGEVLENIKSIAEAKREGSFEQMVVTQMGLSIGVLADISMSLAVIADAMKERNENHE